MNRTQLAAIFGVAATTVDAWVGRGCPFIARPTERGKGWKFNTAAVSAWRESQAFDRALEDRSDVDLAEARRRKAVADAELVELDLAERRGELLPVADSEAALIALASGVQRRLLAVPSKVAPLAHAAQSTQEAEALIRDAIYEALQDLADAGDAIAAEAERP